ncbi:MAG: peptide chain release factor N(5)-glutamine methyltransferase [Micrococcales bacterium]|nr:peptide chain release factor N(5)-glutamine methyltransferase [Micrococcales bacterium]
MKIQELLAATVEKFSKAGIESAKADAEILLGYVLGLSRGELLSRAITNGEISVADRHSFEQLAVRRAQREPLQHLTGRAAFRSLELIVGPGVFVPRFETENVVEKAIAELRNLNVADPIVVDLATGSGAIALSLAVEIPTAKVFAVELSEDALVYTRQNFANYAPEAVLVQGDLAQAFPELNGKVDLLISNPPYIPNEMIPIYPEVHLHDPKLALYGGVDGLDIVRKVDQRARELVRPGGKLVIEHADMQGSQVRQILVDSDWQNVYTGKDLAGRDRMVIATR